MITEYIERKSKDHCFGASSAFLLYNKNNPFFDRKGKERWKIDQWLDVGKVPQYFSKPKLPQK